MSDRRDGHLRGEPLRCPNCGTNLVELERSDVLIDACPKCRGVWLDRGELDRVLDRERRMSAGVGDDDQDFLREMSGGRAPRPAPPPEPRRYEAPRDDYRDDDYRRKRKRRSVLEDLFDFD